MSMLTNTHNKQECHKSNEERRKVVQQLKSLVNCLQECDRYGNSSENEAYPPEWAVPLITYPLTPDRAPRPDPPETVAAVNKSGRRSVQVLGGRLVKGCQCPKRNGLQADCKMTGCQGSDLCLTKPDPLCPNGGFADQLVSPEQAAQLLERLPGPAPTLSKECIPGQSCRPNCVPCSSSLSDICKFDPKWIESAGNSENEKSKTKDSSQAGQGGSRAGTHWWCCIAKYPDS